MAESEDIHFPMICNWPCILFFMELFYKSKTYLLAFSVSQWLFYNHQSIFHFGQMSILLQRDGNKR